MKDTQVIKTIQKDGSFIFTKVKPSDTDLRSFVFQSYLHKNLKNSFKICEPVSITSDGSCFNLNYKFVEQERVILNETVLRQLGAFTAELHNFCFQN